jgi:hypothetical protein
MGTVRLPSKNSKVDAVDLLSESLVFKPREFSVGRLKGGHYGNLQRGL